MKKHYMILIALISSIAFAAGPGGLEESFINKLQKDFKMDTHSRAIYNAITGSSIPDLTLNRDIISKHNTLYSNKIKAKGITNQKSSGRCWLFAALNIMRPQLIEKHKLKSFEFSQNYLSFWDKFEKSNTFLERIIEFRELDPLDRKMEIILKNPIPDGGWWEGAVGLIEKYGVVPKQAMPETNSSESTSAMNKIISKQLRIYASRLRDLNKQGKDVQALRKEKEKMLKDIYRLLVMNLGQPPMEFQWRYEDPNSVVTETDTYTPQQFYKDYVGLDLRQYVNVFNDPVKEYGRLYVMQMTTNVYDKPDVAYANTKIEDLKKLAKQAILDDQPVWFACDMGKDQSSKLGIMASNLYDYDSMFKIRSKISKADQVLYREGIPNHAMVFVGVDLKDDKPVKWMVENSWGSAKGSSGYWALYDDWFSRHVYCVIIHQKYLTDKLKKVFEQQPVVLPPWDPMYKAFVD